MKLLTAAKLLNLLASAVPADLSESDDEDREGQVRFAALFESLGKLSEEYGEELEDVLAHLEDTDRMIVLRERGKGC